MRKLLLVFCYLASVVAQAQLTSSSSSTFKTMLKPGRVWQMSHHTLNLFHEEEGTEYHTTKSYMLFVGEAFVDEDGHTCYEIIYGDLSSDIKPYPVAFVYEEDGKLYESTDDCALPPSPRLILDFTPLAGGKYPYYDGDDSNLYFFSYRDVNMVDSILVNGELHKRIHLGRTGYENEETYLVEGIGISNDNLLYYQTYYESATNGIIRWKTLDAVYDDGTCIFSASDFSKPAYNESADSIPEPDVVSIWTVGSEWQVFCEHEVDTEGPTAEIIVRYRLGHAENGYMALEKTESIDGVKGTPEVIGYIRNDGDSLIYVRPVLQDGSTGAESLLYDFSTPFEYGNTVRYGVEGGGMKEEYIDWQKDSLDYYMLNGDSHLLPAWGGIIYRYGYIGGPMELFQRHYVPSRTKGPKPTNISHVIFTTKGGQKTIRRVAPQSDAEISVPYNPMLTDGTKWEYLTVQKDCPQNMNTYMVEVIGDTIIGNRSCKRVASPEHDINKVLFEEGRKLYLVSDDSTPVVLLDFGLLQGDVIDEVTSVLGVRTIENQGNSYRIITIDTGMDCASLYAGDTAPWYYTLIEGVGVSKDEYLTEHLAQEENVVSYLLRCWKGGVLVYQDPFYDTTTGITQIALKKRDSIYDLQGRQLKNGLQKGILIFDDKKIIKR